MPYLQVHSTRRVFNVCGAGLELDRKSLVTVGSETDQDIFRVPDEGKKKQFGILLQNQTWQGLCESGLGLLVPELFPHWAVVICA